MTLTNAIPLPREPTEHQRQLADYLTMNVPRVRVIAKEDCCWRCRELDGMEMATIEAFEMDVLPCRLCKNDECRCRYRYVLS